jgi:hypothetical protein
LGILHCFDKFCQSKKIKKVGENILRTDKGQITVQSMTPEDLASFKQIFQRMGPPASVADKLPRLKVEPIKPQLER